VPPEKINILCRSFEWDIFDGGVVKKNDGTGE